MKPSEFYPAPTRGGLEQWLRWTQLMRNPFTWWISEMAQMSLLLNRRLSGCFMPSNRRFEGDAVSSASLLASSRAPQPERSAA
jgi:hypothetical protein